MFKKFIAVLLALVLVLSFAACDKKVAELEEKIESIILYHLNYFFTYGKIN